MSDAPSKRVAARLVLTVYDDETMSVEGPLHDTRWCLLAVEHAKDILKSRLARERGEIVIPARDMELPKLGGA